MINGGFDAEPGECPYTSYAEYQLLSNPAVPVVGVKPAGDLSILGIIFRNVCVQKIEMNAAHIYLPYDGCDFAAGEFDGYGNGISLEVQGWFNRKRGGIVIGMFRGLISFFIYLLFHVSLPIQEAHAYYRQFQVEIGRASCRERV